MSFFQPRGSQYKHYFQTSKCRNKPIKHEEIKNYRFVGCIGRGNFGDVYKAYDLKLQKTVAIKAINIENSNDEIPILLQEINLLRSLRHPNITNWYKTFIVDVAMFIVMEFCSEGSCSDLLRFHKTGLEEHVVSYIMQNVLNGLKYLHSFGVIHRDLKSENILIAKDNVIKIADFGVSGQMIGNRGRKTLVGTPYWMAPEIVSDRRLLVKDRENLERRLIENGLGKRTLYKLWKSKIEEDEIKNRNSINDEQVSLTSDDSYEKSSFSDEINEVKYDEKVDIWSLGITLIELGTGKVPNNEKDPLKTLFKIPKLEPPRVPITASYFMREFGLACLCKDPIIRPTAEELLKFKFITKNKLKSQSLSVLSGHSDKFRRKNPKFNLDFENDNYGPMIRWNFQNNRVEDFQNVNNISTNFQSNSEHEFLPDSVLEEEKTFSNTFLNNNISNIKPTANTSPLIDEDQNTTGKSTKLGLRSGNDMEHERSSSKKINQIIQELEKQLNNDKENSNHGITMRYMQVIKEALMYFKRGNVNATEHLLKGLSDLS